MAVKAIEGRSSFVPKHLFFGDPPSPGALVVFLPFFSFFAVFFKKNGEKKTATKIKRQKKRQNLNISKKRHTKKRQKSGRPKKRQPKTAFESSETNILKLCTKNLSKNTYSQKNGKI